MKRDRVADFFRERTPRRALALLLFIGLMVLFRKLFILLAFFVVFERALSFSAGGLARRLRWGRGKALGVVLGASAAVLTVLAALSAGRIAKTIAEARDTLPGRIADLRGHPWFLQLQDLLPDSEKLAQAAEHYAAEVAHSAAEVGHAFVYAIIGLVLAVVSFLEHEELEAFRSRLAPGSLMGTLARWFAHLAEAVSLTIQLQLIVAACNTVLTLPVLLLLGVPHIPALMGLIFVSSLIPVVGNLLSGAVLMVLAYQVKGWLGVGLFLALTFILHKVESYYLNPRLTARHVPLPGFVLILSLLAWEHLLGFVGLFVSFPFLFVAGKLRREFAEEDAAPVSVPLADALAAAAVALPQAPAPAAPAPEAIAPAATATATAPTTPDASKRA